jgi:hypothetical protein
MESSTAVPQKAYRILINHLLYTIHKCPTNEPFYVFGILSTQHCQVNNSPARRKALLRCVAFGFIKSLFFSFSKEPR